MVHCHTSEVLQFFSLVLPYWMHMPNIEAEIQKKLKQATGHYWVCQLWDYIFIWLTTSKKEIIPEIPRIPGNNQEYIQYPENPTGHCLSATSFNRTKVYIFPDVCSILISCHWIEAAQHPPTSPRPLFTKDSIFFATQPDAVSLHKYPQKIQHKIQHLFTFLL